MGGSPTMQELDAVMYELDSNGDHMVDFPEFLTKFMVRAAAAIMTTTIMTTDLANALMTARMCSLASLAMCSLASLAMCHAHVHARPNGAVVLPKAIHANAPCDLRARQCGNTYLEIPPLPHCRRPPLARAHYSRQPCHLKKPCHLESLSSTG